MEALPLRLVARFVVPLHLHSRGVKGHYGTMEVSIVSTTPRETAQARELPLAKYHSAFELADIALAVSPALNELE